MWTVVSLSVRVGAGEGCGRFQHRSIVLGHAFVTFRGVSLYHRKCP